MIERDIIAEIGINAATYLALFSLAMAFTKQQVVAIRERDHNTCQAPWPHDCNGDQHLEVHHIMPQGYCKQMGINPDYAENGLTLCEEAHQGYIHPDSHTAKTIYRSDKRAFSRVMSHRKDMLRNRQPYWNERYDRQMSVVAVRNTQRARAEGWVFPSKDEKEDTVLYDASKK